LYWIELEIGEIPVDPLIAILIVICICGSVCVGVEHKKNRVRGGIQIEPIRHKLILPVKEIDVNCSKDSVCAFVLTGE